MRSKSPLVQLCLPPNVAFLRETRQDTPRRVYGACRGGSGPGLWPRRPRRAPWNRMPVLRVRVGRFSSCVPPMVMTRARLETSECVSSPRLVLLLSVCVSQPPPRVVAQSHRPAEHICLTSSFSRSFTLSDPPRPRLPSPASSPAGAIARASGRPPDNPKPS